MPWEVGEQFIRSGHKNAADYVADSIRTITLSSQEGIKAVVGKPKRDPKGATEIISYLFSKAKWNLKSAKEWFRDHHIKNNNNSDISLFDLASFKVNMADIAESETELSIPAVFTKEGVHNGLFKPFNELEKNYQDLIGKPVVYLHPPNQRPVNKNDEIIGEVESVYSRRADKAVYGRIKISKNKVREDVLNDIRLGRKRGGSLGYFSTVETTPGIYNGKFYSGVERDMMWDHYAVGYEDGAASIRDGVGLRFNAPIKLTVKNEEKESMSENLDEVSFLDKLEERFKKWRSKEREIEVDNEKETEYKTQIEQLKKQLQDIEKEHKESSKKLEGYEKAEQEKKEKQRKELIGKIVEATDEKPETFEGWDIPQLNVFADKVANPRSSESQQQQQESDAEAPKNVGRADKSAKTPTAGQALGQGSSAEYQKPELLIGNELFGKKQGET